MSVEDDFLGAFEEHSPEGIRRALGAGASATAPLGGVRPIDVLISGYLRSPRFAECLRVLMDAEATIGDPLVEALLLDDDASLTRHLRAKGASELQRFLSVPCAFTSCRDVTALHLCAEFNSVRSARVLLDAGADINAKAGLDADGFGGQTPIFHAVNSILNFCRPMLELLVDVGADLEPRLKGLTWGVDQSWETVVFDVTPMSYAQCGLYAQFHRREDDVYSNLALMYRARFGSDLKMRNVPNRYLAPRT